IASRPSKLCNQPVHGRATKDWTANRRLLLPGKSHGRYGVRRLVGAFGRVTCHPARARSAPVVPRETRTTSSLTATSRLAKAVTSHRTPAGRGSQSGVALPLPPHSIGPARCGSWEAPTSIGPMNLVGAPDSDPARREVVSIEPHRSAALRFLGGFLDSQFAKR